MTKVVVLRISNGSFESGFPLDLQIRKGTNVLPSQHHIPQFPDLPDIYNDFTTAYYSLGLGKMRMIDVPDNQVTNSSLIRDCEQAVEQLERCINNWFTQPVWAEILHKIEVNFQKEEQFRVIIQTDNIYLKKLPWHLWNLFKKRKYAYFALSATDAEAHAPLKHPIRILAIFGGSEGLDLAEDQQLLNSLRNQGAIVKELIQPRREQLSCQLWEQRWDILFFAGHSCRTLDKKPR